MSTVDDLFAQVSALPPKQQAELVQRVLINLEPEECEQEDEIAVDEELAELILERQRLAREEGHITYGLEESLDRARQALAAKKRQ